MADDAHEGPDDGTEPNADSERHETSSSAGRSRTLIASAAPPAPAQPEDDVLVARQGEDPGDYAKTSRYRAVSADDPSSAGAAGPGTSETEAFVGLSTARPERPPVRKERTPPAGHVMRETFGNFPNEQFDLRDEVLPADEDTAKIRQRDLTDGEDSGRDHDAPGDAPEPAPELAPEPAQEPEQELVIEVGDETVDLHAPTGSYAAVDQEIADETVDESADETADETAGEPARAEPAADSNSSAETPRHDLALGHDRDSMALDEVPPPERSSSGSSRQGVRGPGPLATTGGPLAGYAERASRHGRGPSAVVKALVFLGIVGISYAVIRGFDGSSSKDAADVQDPSLASKAPSTGDAAAAGETTSGPEQAPKDAQPEQASPPQETAGETGAGETGAGETGAGETGAGETGAGETGAGETDAGETGASETGAGQTGEETGAGESGTAEPGTAESGTATPGIATPGTAEPAEATGDAAPGQEAAAAGATAPGATPTAGDTLPGQDGQTDPLAALQARLPGDAAVVWREAGTLADGPLRNEAVALQTLAACALDDGMLARSTFVGIRGADLRKTTYTTCRDQYQVDVRRRIDGYHYTELNRMSARAMAAGDFRKAYDLAYESFGQRRTDEAATLLGKLNCELGRPAKAARMAKLSNASVKEAIVSYCAGKGVTLSLD